MFAEAYASGICVLTFGILGKIHWEKNTLSLSSKSLLV